MLKPALLRPHLPARAAALLCLALVHCGEPLPPTATIKSAASKGQQSWAQGAAPASSEALEVWLDPQMWSPNGHLACDPSPSPGDSLAGAEALPTCQHLYQMPSLRLAAALCRASGGGFAPDWGLCHCPADQWFVPGVGCEAMPVAGSLDPACPEKLGELLSPGWAQQSARERLRTTACLGHLRLGASAWRIGDDITGVAARKERLLADLLRRQPSSWSTCVGPPTARSEADRSAWLITTPDATGLAAALASLSPACGQARAGEALACQADNAPRTLLWEPSPDSRKGLSAAAREQACRRALADLGVVPRGAPESRLPSRIFGPPRAGGQTGDQAPTQLTPATGSPQEAAGSQAEAEADHEAHRESDGDGDGDGEAADIADPEAEIASLLGTSADHPCGQLLRLAAAQKNAAANTRGMPAWRRVTLHPEHPQIGLETVVAQPVDPLGPLTAELQWLMQDGAVLQRRLHLRDACLEMIAFLASDGRLLGVAGRVLPAPVPGRNATSPTATDGAAKATSFRLWGPSFATLMAKP